MNPVRVFDVEGLGQRGLVVDAAQGRLLLLEVGLSSGERIEIMSAVLGLPPLVEPA